MSRARKQDRFLSALAVSYREPTSSEPSLGSCVDISPSGMFIETARPAARGVLVRFECVSTAPEGVVRGTARVMWLRPHHDAQGRAGMGVRFVRLEPGSTRMIEDLIAQAAPNPQARLASDGPEGRIQGEEPAVLLTAERTIGPTNRSSSAPPQGLRAPTLRGMRPADVRSDTRSSSPPAAGPARQERRSEPPSYRDGPANLPDARNNAGSNALRERLAASRPPAAPSASPSRLAQATAAAAQAAAAQAASPRLAASPSSAHEGDRTTKPDGSAPLPSTSASPSQHVSSANKSLGATVHNLAPPPARLSASGNSGARRGSDHALGVPSPPPPPWKARQSERPPEPGGVEVIRTVTVSSDTRGAERSPDSRSAAGSRSAETQAHFGPRAEAEPAAPHVPNNLPGSEDAHRPEWEPIVEPARPAIRPDRPPLQLSTPYVLTGPQGSTKTGFRHWPAVIVLGSGAAVAFALAVTFSGGLGSLLPRGDNAVPAPSPPIESEPTAPVAKTHEDESATKPTQVVLVARVEPKGARITAHGQSVVSPGELTLPIASVTWPITVRAEMPGYGAAELKLPQHVFEEGGARLSYELLLSLQPNDPSAAGAAAPAAARGAGATPNAPAAPPTAPADSAAKPSPAETPVPPSAERKSRRRSTSQPTTTAATTAAAPATAPVIKPAPTPPAPAPTDAPLMLAAPPPAAPAEPAPSSAGRPFEKALGCLSKGDNACVISSLEGSTGARELDLLIETHRAQGNAAAADKAMTRYLELHPGGRRAPQYRRALGLAEPSSAP